MKSRRTKKHVQTIRVWDHDEAKRALPYVASLVRSIREHRLDAQQHHLTVKRLAAKPGRPTRDVIMAHEDALKAAREADDRFEDALGELNALDIYCLEPIHGTALIPFTHDNDLAWYVYDMFEHDELKTWRLHTDPLDTRRPVTELTERMEVPVAV